MEDRSRFTKTANSKADFPSQGKPSQPLAPRLHAYDGPPSDGAYGARLGCSRRLCCKGKKTRPICRHRHEHVVAHNEETMLLSSGKSHTNMSTSNAEPVVLLLTEILLALGGVPGKRVLGLEEEPMSIRRPPRFWLLSTTNHAIRSLHVGTVSESCGGVCGRVEGGSALASEPSL